MLRKNFFSAQELIQIVRDFRQAGLPAVEVAIMEFAQKVAAQPGQMDQADYDRLRSFNLSEEEVLDILLAATARSFFSKTLDALDAPPDEVYLELEPELIKAFNGVRPFPRATAESG